jgi:hypothetical protein
MGDSIARKKVFLLVYQVQWPDSNPGTSSRTWYVNVILLAVYTYSTIADQNPILLNIYAPEMKKKAQCDPSDQN